MYYILALEVLFLTSLSNYNALRAPKLSKEWAYPTFTFLNCLPFQTCQAGYMPKCEWLPVLNYPWEWCAEVCGTNTGWCSLLWDNLHKSGCTDLWLLKISLTSPVPMQRNEKWVDISSRREVKNTLMNFTEYLRGPERQAMKVKFHIQMQTISPHQWDSS